MQRCNRSFKEGFNKNRPGILSIIFSFAQRMKRITALFFSVLYFAFFAGTAINADRFNLAFSEDILKQSEGQTIDKNESAAEWDGYTAHLNQAIKHFGATGKTKLPRTKSNFVAPSYSSTCKQACFFAQPSASVRSNIATAPLYIKNRVLRI